MAMKEEAKKMLLSLIQSSGAVYLINYLRINTALSRGALTSQLRQIEDSNPLSWEFSAFSQNGEDGILDYLTRKIKDPNRYFIEIGSYDGIECNSAYLAIAQKYNGLMIEGDKKLAGIAAKMMPYLNLGCVCVNKFITRENAEGLSGKAQYKNPDVFSLDIDGVDYYIVEKVFEEGFQPKIFVVEYNSVYGPDQSLTIDYQEEFDYFKADPSRLYYGVGVAVWKKFFAKHGYEFVTVDSRGVNAFFVKKDEFDSDFLKNLRGLAFQENFNHSRKYGGSWESQFEKIKHLHFKEV